MSDDCASDVQSSRQSLKELDTKPVVCYSCVLFTNLSFSAVAAVLVNLKYDTIVSWLRLSLILALIRSFDFEEFVPSHLIEKRSWPILLESEINSSTYLKLTKPSAIKLFSSSAVAVFVVKKLHVARTCILSILNEFLKWRKYHSRHYQQNFLF